MTQYSTSSVKFSDSELIKLKSGIENGTEVTLKPSLNFGGDSNDDNKFPHKFLLTNTQVSKIRKVYANHYSANMKLSKTHLHRYDNQENFEVEF